MASTFVPTPTYPNVPDALGVPQIPRNPSVAPPDPPPPPLSQDTVVEGIGANPQQWGIYDYTGSPILVGQTAFQMQYMREYKVSDYPVEDGAFASYNKVQLPFVGRFTFLQGGSLDDKGNFLIDCENICSDLNLYQLVTPEITYHNVNVTHYDYDRTAAKGVGLMYVEVWVEQIRVAPPAAFTSTKSPTAKKKKNIGTVAPQTPPANSPSKSN